MLGLGHNLPVNAVLCTHVDSDRVAEQWLLQPILGMYLAINQHAVLLLVCMCRHERLRALHLLVPVEAQQHHCEHHCLNRQGDSSNNSQLSSGLGAVTDSTRQSQMQPS